MATQASAITFLSTPGQAFVDGMRFIQFYLGSVFYGTILGIFLIAFYFKSIGGHATFIAAVIAESVVVFCYFFTQIPYLWFNVIGCLTLILMAHICSPWFQRKRQLG